MKDELLREGSFGSGECHHLLSSSCANRVLLGLFFFVSPRLQEPFFLRGDQRLSKHASRPSARAGPNVARGVRLRVAPFVFVNGL